MSLLMKGICGATLTPVGTPAAASVRRVRRRRAGVAARGSSWRANAASSVVMVTYTAASPRAASGAIRSRSRSTALDLVMMENGCRDSPSTSISARVRRKSRSAG